VKLKTCIDRRIARRSILLAAPVAASLLSRGMAQKSTPAATGRSKANVTLSVRDFGATGHLNTLPALDTQKLQHCRLTCSMLAAIRSSAPPSSSLRPDSSCSTECRMNAVGDEKPRFRAAS